MKERLRVEFFLKQTKQSKLFGYVGMIGFSLAERENVSIYDFQTFWKSQTFSVKERLK